MEGTEPAQKPRSSSRITNKERRKENTARRARTEIGRLDADAFARRSKFLREVFLDPERRHTYEWTGLEKKILALDWFHNPALYKTWKPSETEDMATRLFTNLVFNFSHLAMVNVGSTVVVCRLINEFVDICGNYQLIFMVVRSEIGEQDTQDTLRVGLVWRGDQTEEKFGAKQTLVYSTPKPEDYQCIFDGIGFNVGAQSAEEFMLYETCESCQNKKIDIRTQLSLPEVCFKAHVVGLEVTSAIVDGRRNYIAAVQKVDGCVHIIDITKMLQVSLEVVHKWKTKHAEWVAKCKEKLQKFYSPDEAKPDAPAGRSRGGGNNAGKVKKFCTGCQLNEPELKVLETIKRTALDFALPIQPILCRGLDVAAEPLKGVPFRRISHETSLTFVYSSIENIKVVVPVFLAAVGGSKVCVWRIGDVNDTSNREPIMEMSFPEGCRPTDVAATLGIAKDYAHLLADKFQYEPLFYTADDCGYLRVWALGSKQHDAALKVDTNALLSLDVNIVYPNMVAIGVETGKIKIYNVWKQCVTSAVQTPEVNLARLTTIPSYLPNDVYEYLRWYHPVVKVKWVNATLVMAQYAEPLFVKESTNASTVAIWNLAKDIFDRSDAILCHKAWSQDMTSSWHLASRLVCLYGGHFASLGGALSSDCRWSNDHGIVAISTDATGQLHVYKPGIWTWADYDDGLCLARFRGDVEFHKRILNKVKQEHNYLLNGYTPDSKDAMASSDLRKNKAKFNDFIESAKLQLDTIAREKTLKNDFNSLPNWAKRTLKLNTDADKLLKQIHKNLREREMNEHRLSGNTVER